MVHQLLEAGVRADTTDRDGETALMAAAFSGDLRTAEELVGHGANVNTASKYGVTPLMETAGRHLPVMQFLIRDGANVNAKNALGETALILATRANCGEAVALLLKAGADPNARASSGETALSTTSCNGQSYITRLLKRAGARN